MPINMETEIGYRILPRWGRVHAEVFQIYNKYLETHLISKSFGSRWKEITAQDYVDAKIWVDMHLDSINKSNNL